MTGHLSMWPAILGLAAAMIVVTIIQPVPHSLGYASAGIVLLSMLGWILEAREVAGPAPEVEPEHEEEEQPPGPSYWPLVLAIGTVGIAVGLVWAWDYGALVAAVPLAAWSGSAWLMVIARDAAEAGEVEEAGPLIVGPSGEAMAPVADHVLAAQAAGGAAIAIERVQTREVSRRGLLRITFWTGMLAGLGAIGASMVDMLYPRGITGFGSVIAAGTVDQFPPGSRTQVSVGKFWLVNLTEEEARLSDPVNGKAGFLALWWKCPHLGCTIPYQDNYTFSDRRGWFLCPCHGSTYDNAGVRVFGPAPRSMDRMAVTIDPDSGRISVNTGDIEKGSPDNAAFAVVG